MNTRGRLITIEGIDGSGKTTLSRSLAEALTERGVAVDPLREPGGVPLSERLREVVKDTGLTIGPRAEALIYAAARAQLVEQAVRPRLDAGTWVLLDRFLDSSLAYQGAGRELGVEPVRAINQFAIGGLDPDRTLLLLIDPAQARARATGRDAPPDRLEQAGADFFDRVDRAYRELARAEPGRVRALDATRPPRELAAAAVAALEDLL